jgi:branched-subunit amino acid transport protein
MPHVLEQYLTYPMKVFYKIVLPKVFLQTLIQVGPEVRNPKALASTLCELYHVD